MPASYQDEAAIEHVLSLLIVGNVEAARHEVDKMVAEMVRDVATPLMQFLADHLRGRLETSNFYLYIGCLLTLGRDGNTVLPENALNIILTVEQDPLVLRAGQQIQEVARNCYALIHAKVETRNEQYLAKEVR